MFNTREVTNRMADEVTDEGTEKEATGESESETAESESEEKKD